MRKRVLLGIVGLFFFAAALLAQNVPEGVIAAFKKGSSQELSGYLGDKVTLIILNRTTDVDRQMAEKMMSIFFADYKVISFNVSHQDSRDESGFVIGSLATVKGDFRVNCFLRKVQNKYLIHQIRIDKRL